MDRSDETKPFSITEKIKIRWSSSKLTALRQIADGSVSSGHRIDATLACAQIAAAEGNFTHAEPILLSAFAEYGSQSLSNNVVCLALLTGAFVVQRLDLVGELLAEKFDTRCKVDVAIAESGPGVGAVIWDVLLPRSMRFTFDSSILQRDQTHALILKMFWIFPVFAAYSRKWPGETGSVLFSNWDNAVGPGVAMCSNRSDCFLIPDNVFVPTRGYEALRREFAAVELPWEKRRPKAFFRGSTTGLAADDSHGWRSLPRIRLSELGRDHPDLIDAGITRVVQLTDQNVEAELREAHLLRAPVHRTEYKSYKYQIDIDGNTNAWAGFYERLLTGSPVLKVESPYGFRQWYYDKLKPWVNYVPVLSDMSDLVEKVLWLQHNDEVAHKIGEGGQALALSLNFHTEMDDAVRTLSAALRYFSKRPETELYFGMAREDNSCLRDGWLVVEGKGAPTCGFESFLELPRPVAACDFRLAIDVSPRPEVPSAPPQRITIIANGEVLFCGQVERRLNIECMLPKSCLQKSDSLIITLLHPDARQCASAEHPLAEQVISLLLHGLSLVPVWSSDVAEAASVLHSATNGG
jgi:hypothetical protein